MDPVWKAILWAVAIVLFVLSARLDDYRGWRLLPLGLAVFTVPFFWDAVSAT